MKISVLTPTYNDAKSIVETLDSLFLQNYKNFESIIIDDGSTDNTKEIIKNYKKSNDKDNKIKYIYQENKDQLNALINGLEYITGDLIYILHSDDLIPSVDFFEKSVNYFKKNPKTDSIIGDLIIINEKSEVTNRWKALDYKNYDNLATFLMLNNGCNIFGDFGIHKKKIFLNQIRNNYMTWNTPFWIDFNNNAKPLNVKTVDFPVLKYRIHSENYANNEIGKFNALNGELRTLTNLLSIYKLKFFPFQNIVFRFNRMRGIRRFRLLNHVKPTSINCKTNDYDIYKLVRKAVYSTYKDGTDNIYLIALLNFYKNLGNETKISLDVDKEDTAYYGKDIRIFTKKLFNNELDKIYYQLFASMNNGFKTIIVKDKIAKDKMEIITKFLCIYPYIDIKIKGEK